MRKIIVAAVLGGGLLMSGCSGANPFTAEKLPDFSGGFSSTAELTYGKLTAQADIDRILTALDSGDYGAILRAKGIVNGTDGAWIEFDYVPEEHEIRAGHPDYTGRLCVIGSNLKEEKLAELFGL